MKILIADDDASRAQSVSRRLAIDPGVEVIRIAPGEMLADAVAAHAPDLVLVDMARPDRDALEGLRQLSVRAPHPVVLFVDEDDPDFMQEAINAGVSSYNVAHLAPADVKPILRAAMALFQRHRRTIAALDAATAKLEERRVVDRAKALLIRERAMAEPDAYRWLRRRAMSHGRRIVEIARELLREEDAP